MAFRKKRPLRRKVVKRARKPRQATVSLAVKKYVKRAIHVDQENKVKTIYYSHSFGSSANNPSLYSYPMTPYTGYISITQGVGQSERCGNEIKIRKVMLNYVLTPNGYNVDSNAFPAPVHVDMFLGRTKLCPGDQPIAGDMAQLFQNNNASSAPAGTLQDLIGNVNTDYWLIKKRWQHKIGFAAAEGAGAISNLQFYQNNDYRMNVLRKLDITKHYPKTIKFNDNNTTQQGPGLFLFYQCVNALGGTQSASTLPCAIKFWVEIQYEDA